MNENFKYDVALSFAGEDRRWALELAQNLRAIDVKVFYDEFAKAEIWGKDLYEYLADVYSKHAQYCIMFLSENYARKAWTNHERKNAQARAFKENKEYILPLKIDDTIIPGINETIGYIDIRQTSIKEIVNLIGDKLGKEQTKYYNFMENIKLTSLTTEKLKEYAVKILIDEQDPLLYQDYLVEDRSKEAIQIFLNISIEFDAFGNGSFGIGGLARIGKPAIPQLVELLLSPDPLSKYCTLYEIIELENLKRTEFSNYIEFLTELGGHEKWPEIVKDFEELVEGDVIDADKKQFIKKSIKVPGFLKKLDK